MEYVFKTSQKWEADDIINASNYRRAMLDLLDYLKEKQKKEECDVSAEIIKHFAEIRNEWGFLI